MKSTQFGVALSLALSISQGIDTIYIDEASVMSDSMYHDLVPQQSSAAVANARWRGDEETDPYEYSEPVANRSLMFAYTAYCDNLDWIKDWNCNYCETIPKFKVDMVYEHRWMLAFTGYDPEAKQVVISFRGTDNARGWLLDANMKPEPYPGVENATVHAGFWKAWENLRDRVMRSAKKLMDRHSGDEILVTGHSLGGALSMVSALEIFQYANDTGNPAIRKVETFGCPRWGNDELVAHFMSLTNVNWRVVHHHDCVPHLPPKSEHYHHAPTMVWYNRVSPKLHYKICDGSGEDPDCHYYNPINSAADHSLYMGVTSDCEPLVQE